MSKDSTGIIIAIINNKGGTGKTTAAANIAHALGLLKKNVLIIDTDSECNLTKIFASGFKPKKTLYEILDGSCTDVSNAITMTEYENVKCILNTEETSMLEYDLVKNKHEPFTVLKNIIEKYAKKNFDYTIIDCPPNFGYFIISVLMFADAVIIPCESGSTKSIDGAQKAMKLIAMDRKSRGNNIQWAKILLNKMDMRTILANTTIQIAHSVAGEQNVLKTFIPINEIIKQADAVKKTAIRFSSGSAAGRAFKALGKEIHESFLSEV